MKTRDRGGQSRRKQLFRFLTLAHRGDMVASTWRPWRGSKGGEPDRDTGGSASTRCGCRLFEPPTRRARDPGARGRGGRRDRAPLRRSGPARRRICSWLSRSLPTVARSSSTSTIPRAPAASRCSRSKHRRPRCSITTRRSSRTTAGTSSIQDVPVESPEEGVTVADLVAVRGESEVTIALESFDGQVSAAIRVDA